VGLVSQSLLVSLVAVMVVAVVGTVALWPRLAGRGPASVAGRLSTLLLCQVLAVALTGVLLNRYFSFYASWSELLPQSSSARAVGLTPVTPPPGGGGHSLVTGTGATGAPATLGARVGTPDHRPGRLVPVTVPGTGGLSESGYVYLPPQYDAHPAERFPAVLVLAGYPGHVITLVHRLEVPGQMNRQLSAGTVHPMVMVLMSPTVAPPRDTECADVPGGPQVATYLSRDVPAYVSAHFRVRPTWGVLGASTGGFCATKLATTHPGTFAAAVSMSGTVHPREDSTTGELYGHQPALRERSDATWLLRHRPVPRVSYLLTASRTEGEVYGDLRDLVAVVRPPASVQTIVLAKGGHNFGVWLRELPTCLQWLSARLSA